MNEYTNEINDINEDCINCPQLRAMLDRADYHRAESDDIIENATSDEIPEMIAELASIADVQGHDMGGTPEQIVSEIRGHIADKVIELNKRADSIEQNAHALAVGCLGALTMRATSHGKRTTINICQSAVMPDGVHVEPAVIRRETVSDE